MDHDVHRGRSRHLKTTPPMHVGSQRPLARWLLNIHRPQLELAEGPSVIVGYLLAATRQACSHHTTLLQWLTDMVFIVALDQCDDESKG